jgi:hypothetical protein
MKHREQTATVSTEDDKAEMDGWSVGVCDLNVSGGKTGHQRGLAQDRPFVAVL